MRPRLLDLYCGAGGAAMGYARAGFDVVGVDRDPQPRYPFTMVRADALAFLDADGWVGFDAVHASPPCQAYSIMGNLPWVRDIEYWDAALIPATRDRLEVLPMPYLIENVRGAPLDGIYLCGAMFGLRFPDGRPLYRHRVFESSFFTLAPGHPKHYEAVLPGRMLGRRQTRMSEAEAMGIDWMTKAELGQAIPPAYTEWLGARLLAHLEA